MINDIQDIRFGLGSGRYMNEAAISQGIVMRLLNLLEWPTYDTRVVWPEYATEARRVDFALCHPPTKPTVFIEVKQAGNDVNADRQLFEYAFHKGVPLAILTTGQEWHFFLPSGQGDYSERRVYKLDLLEREPEESELRLKRYLQYRRVCNGEALDAAQDDYKSIAKEREIQRTLPEALSRLVEEQDEILIDLVAEKVESLCGYRPEDVAVVRYLNEKFELSGFTTSRRQQSPASSNAKREKGRKSEIGTVVSIPEQRGFVLKGEVFGAKNARQTYIRIFQELGRRDPEFFERFHQRTSARKGRPYLARSRKELFPKNPGLADDLSQSTEVVPNSGWWLDLNLSNDTKLRILRTAADVADLELGVDLIVSFGD